MDRLSLDASAEPSAGFGGAASAESVQRFRRQVEAATLELLGALQRGPHAAPVVAASPTALWFWAEPSTPLPGTPARQREPR